MSQKAHRPIQYAKEYLENRETSASHWDLTVIHNFRFFA